MDAPDEHKQHAPARLGFAVLTMSDSRDARHDESGDLIVSLVEQAGHTVTLRRVVRDEKDAILHAFDEALAHPGTAVVVTTGGTGIAPRDVALETIASRFEKTLPGFGELFRMLSWEEVGSAAMASRAAAGTCQGRLVFLLPGSPKACRLATVRLVLPEAGHLVGLLRR